MLTHRDVAIAYVIERYVCKYMYLCVCVIAMYVNRKVCMYVRKYMYLCVCIIAMYVNRNVSIYMYVCLSVCMQAYVFVRV